MQPYRGMILWNKLFPKYAITENSSMKILEFKKSLTEEFIQENLDEKIYNAICELREEHGESLTKYPFLDILAIPFNNTEFPEEFLPFVDVDMIINQTMSKGNILLDSLGFTLVKSAKFETASNIISF